MDRRLFVTDLARYAALAAVVPRDWRVIHRPRFADDPFTLGVASGDPGPTGAVIWTRLAPRPLEAEGGMDGRRVAVEWQVADDEGFSRVVLRGRATAAPELGYSIHVDLQGLAPDRWYFYRFATPGATGATSPIGRLRTTPAPGALTPLHFAVASCQHYETGFFTAYHHMAEEELDLVTHLGDYIYEYGGYEGRVRRHAGLEIRTVDDYRRRYAQYRSDPLLQAAHARCPWLVTWDDHEVDNNYAGEHGENDMESAEQVRARRAAGYQAWWEHMPVRVPRAQSWADLDITRRAEWGALARFHVLDTRQYRSDQACGDGQRIVPCGDWAAPARSLLGARQEGWLGRGLARPGARWQVLAQQVMVASYDADAGPAASESMDPWSGYPAARERLMRDLGRHAPNAAVVLTGDIHSSWVNELPSTFARERAARPRPVAAEFVGTSIASGGDGGDRAPWVTAEALAGSPHTKWHDGRRGYMRCTVTADTWRTDYRTVPFVSRPDAPVQTATSWRVVRGEPGVHRV